MNWDGTPVVVTGGASFIGSHLVDRLCNLGADVTVVDDLSSGSLDNLAGSPKCHFVKMDLENATVSEVERVFRGNQFVFHLAANHGGRGYIDAHPAEVCSNFAIDHHVIEGASNAEVERVAMASSACVYPPSLQRGYDSKYLLREEDSDSSELSKPMSADLEYGWAKLMGEVQLKAFIREYGLKGCNVRFVTAYGERENETHAIIALIYKAHERMNPFVIWGNGNQSRDFTYVGDIVEGTILSAERIVDGTSINLGTGTPYRLVDVAGMVFDLMGFHPKVEFDETKPVGVASRALDTTRARSLLGWEPKVPLKEGLRRTIEWYVQSHPRKGIMNERLLMERTWNS